MIISSATRVSSGEPRSRCSMLTKPLPGSAADAAVGGPVDAEVVVLAVAVVRGFAAPGFEHLGEFPEQLQLVAVGKLRKAGGQGIGVEQRLDVVVAQVGDDGHALHARFVAEQAVVGSDVEVERDCGDGMPGGQREMLDDVLRQHGDLAPRHIHGGQPFAGDAAEVGVRTEAEARCGDVDADLPAAVGFGRDRKRIVDLGRVRIVDTEGGDSGERQIGGFAGRRRNREIPCRPCSRGKTRRGSGRGGSRGSRAARRNRTAGAPRIFRFRAQAASSALVSGRLRSGL
jgi:hypothetical protein